MKAPVLNENNVDKYLSFVDKILHAYLPNKNENPDFQELVKLYQLHRHSKTGLKYRNDGCTFHFGKSISDQSIVVKTFLSDVPGNMKHSVLGKQKDILSKVKG